MGGYLWWRHKISANVQTKLKSFITLANIMTADLLFWRIFFANSVLSLLKELVPIEGTDTMYWNCYKLLCSYIDTSLALWCGIRTYLYRSLLTTFGGLSALN